PSHPAGTAPPPVEAGRAVPRHPIESLPEFLLGLLLLLAGVAAMICSLVEDTAPSLPGPPYAWVLGGAAAATVGAALIAASVRQRSGLLRPQVIGLNTHRRSD